LTSGSGFWAAWSYDERFILFNRSTVLENTIYIMEAKGERNGGRIFPVIQDEAVGNTGVDWAPDAKSIVFTGSIGSQDGLWIMAVDPDTEQLGTSILVRPGPAAAPVWSADGLKIAFVSYPGPTITVLDLATGVENFGKPGYAPSFSPDGSRLAFRVVGPVTKGNKTTFYSQVFVANVDGTAITQLTKQTDYINFPKWSPDGTQIAFWKKDSTGWSSIQKLTLATGAISLVRKSGQAPDWAP
jgi:Tol biopolymer transport system component